MQAPGAIDVRNPPIQGGNQFPAGQQNDPRAPNNPMTLSKEEQMIFEKCRSESYWYRSLPYSLGLGTAAMYAGKMGYLAAHPKYGPWPKTVIAAAVGYFAGKISISGDVSITVGYKMTTFAYVFSEWGHIMRHFILD